PGRLPERRPEGLPDRVDGTDPAVRRLPAFCADSSGSPGRDGGRPCRCEDLVGRHHRVVDTRVPGGDGGRDCIPVGGGTAGHQSTKEAASAASTASPSGTPPAEETASGTPQEAATSASARGSAATRAETGDDPGRERVTEDARCCRAASPARRRLNRRYSGSSVSEGAR